jgi:hypothetical protein
VHGYVTELPAVYRISTGYCPVERNPFWLDFFTLTAMLEVEVSVYYGLLSGLCRKDMTMFVALFTRVTSMQVEMKFLNEPTSDLT